MFIQHRKSPLALLVIVSACTSAAQFPRHAYAQAAVGPKVAAPDPTEAAAKLTPRQQRWLEATLEQRIVLAEQIGEEGAREYARARGWKPIVDGTTSRLRQGFDQVYRAPDGSIHVVEAKGGSSPRGYAYGFPQGSPEWAVKAAERTLKSPSASAAEKDAARAVIRAASQGNLLSHVVRTKHVLGQPTVAVLEVSAKGTNETVRLARSLVTSLANEGLDLVDNVVRPTTHPSGATKAAPESALGSQGSGGVARVASRAAVPVAIAVDAGLRTHHGAQIERRFGAGEFTQQEREVAHARNAAGMAGGWAGAIAGAKIGGAYGAAGGTCVLPVKGTVIGGCVGAVAGGIAGYLGGEAAAEAVARRTVEAVHSAGTTVSDAAGAASSAVGDACQGAWNWTADTTTGVWQRLRGN